jgi:Na+/melibiose symporter-like transporter
MGIVWIPAVCFAVAMVPVLFYARYEKLEPQIRADLERRRASTAV